MAAEGEQKTVKEVVTVTHLTVHLTLDVMVVEVEVDIHTHSSTGEVTILEQTLQIRCGDYIPDSFHGCN